MNDNQTNFPELIKKLDSLYESHISSCKDCNKNCNLCEKYENEPDNSHFSENHLCPVGEQLLEDYAQAEVDWSWDSRFTT